MSAYLKELNRLTEEYLAAQATQSPTASLRQRFTEWYRELPAISCDRIFAMSEFEAALATQGRFISPVLLELGWRRKRKWSTAGQYHRYWEPPDHKVVRRPGNNVAKSRIDG
jgi:hypothetical protein